MADKPDKKGPGKALPFADNDVDWDSELDAWDAALPIEEQKHPAVKFAPAPPPPVTAAASAASRPSEPEPTPPDMPRAREVPVAPESSDLIEFSFADSQQQRSSGAEPPIREMVAEDPEATFTGPPADDFETGVVREIVAEAAADAPTPRPEMRTPEDLDLAIPDVSELDRAVSAPKPHTPAAAHPRSASTIRGARPGAGAPAPATSSGRPEAPVVERRFSPAPAREPEPGASYDSFVVETPEVERPEVETPEAEMLGIVPGSTRDADRTPRYGLDLEADGLPSLPEELRAPQQPVAPAVLEPALPPHRPLPQTIDEGLNQVLEVVAEAAVIAESREGLGATPASVASAEVTAPSPARIVIPASEAPAPLEPPYDPASLPVESPPPVLDGSYWREQLGFLADELAAARGKEAAALSLAAGRIAERLGDSDAAGRHYVEALRHEPSCFAARRAHALLLERLGRFDLAAEALGEGGAPAIEAPCYDALAAEWRAGDNATPELLLALPSGASRTLAATEHALRAGATDRAVQSLHQTGVVVGGDVGAALLVAAGRFEEVAGNVAGAAALRAEARPLSPTLPGLAFGAVRNAARLEVAAASTELGEALAVLPASAFKATVSRWAARLARQSGNTELARTLLADAAALAPDAVPVARDRLELLDGAAETEADALLAQAARLWSAPADGALLSLRAARRLKGVGDLGGALAALRAGIDADPSAVPLAFAAAEIAESTADPTLKADALRLWAVADPARCAFAELALASVRAGSLGDSEGARAALRAAVAAAPVDASFWSLAHRELVEGNLVGAADVLEAGASAWEGGASAPGAAALVGALRERAAEIRADASPQEAVDRLRRLASSDAVRWTLGRLLLRVGDRAAVEAHLRDESEASDDPLRRAALLVCRSQLSGDPPTDESRVAIEAALAAVPGYPAALAAIMLGASADPARIAVALRAAGEVGPAAVARAVEATGWLVQAGDTTEALALADELFKREPDVEPVRRLLLRLGRLSQDATRRAEILERLGGAAAATAVDGAVTGPQALALERAETLERRGELREAAEAYRRLRDDCDGPLRDAELGLLRTLWRLRDGKALAALYRARAARIGEEEANNPRWRGVSGRRAAIALVDEARAVADLLGDGADALDAFHRAQKLDPDNPEASLAVLLEDARLGRFPEIVAALETEAAACEASSPAAASAYLTLAALVDEGRAGGKESARLVLAAVDKNARSVAAARRAADLELAGATSPEAPASALEVLATAVAGDDRSAAVLLARAGELLESSDNPAAADERYRAALARDQACFGALVPLRRSLVRGGDWAGAVPLYEAQAHAAVVPAHRATMLLAAAVLAQERLEDPVRAEDLLRRVLDIEPENQEAFRRLRAILETRGDHAPLADLLAARIAIETDAAVAVTLRLARAELLIGPLADRAAAKSELAAVLTAAPTHPGALANLAELQYEDGELAAAAKLLILRARVEKTPAALKEIFLRLGRIYNGALPDPKRAIASFGRVVQLDPDHREALDVLSDLYTRHGDAKNAIAVTTRIVELEPDPENRIPYLARLADAWERSGDQRKAGTLLRRAYDEAPRNPEALGALCRYYERAKDNQSRRLVLDRSLGLLRDDLRQNAAVPVLRSMIPVLRWRGAPAAAAAAAQLVAAFSESSAEREAAATWAAPPAHGRRLTALANSEIDDRAFPTALPRGIRQLFRLMGESLAKSARPDIKRWGLSRSDRIARGLPPRDVFDAVAAELGVRDFDLYITREDGPQLALEPGDPPSLVLGVAIVRLGPAAVRFAAARLLRLVASHLDMPLHGTPAEMGALVVGVVRQFVPDYLHPDVPERAAVAEAARLAKVISRAQRQELMAFAVEASAAMDIVAVHDALRDAANWAGLLACGDLPAALAVLATASGWALSADVLRSSPEAGALLRFALSDDYEDLCRALEVV